MSSTNEKRVESAVEWSAGDPADEAWHLDSSLPAAEALSDVSDLTERPLEEPEESEEAEDELDEDAVEATEAEEAEGAPLDDKRRGRRRSKTIARKQMLRDRRRMLSQGTLPEILDYERPVQRSDCRGGQRPCLYVSCRYHLYLDVNPTTGSIKINFPDKEVWELEETCALDVAERGGITLEEVGEIMNLTRERIRQVEVSGLDKLRVGEADLHTFLDGRELEIGARALPVIQDD